jgi:hypothetical protein
VLVTPMPLVKSRYRSPVADARYEPLPEAISISLIGRAIPSASLSRARTRADCGAADADVDADAAVESLRQQWMPARGSGRRVSMDDDRCSPSASADLAKLPIRCLGQCATIYLLAKSNTCRYEQPYCREVTWYSPVASSR